MCLYGTGQVTSSKSWFHHLQNDAIDVLSPYQRLIVHVISGNSYKVLNLVFPSHRSSIFICDKESGSLTAGLSFRNEAVTLKNKENSPLHQETLRDFEEVAEDPMKCLPLGLISIRSSRRKQAALTYTQTSHKGLNSKIVSRSSSRLTGMHVAVFEY